MIDWSLTALSEQKGYKLIIDWSLTALSAQKGYIVP